jgi:hypothetical protein
VTKGTTHPKGGGVRRGGSGQGWRWHHRVKALARRGATSPRVTEVKKQALITMLE